MLLLGFALENVFSICQTCKSAGGVLTFINLKELKNQEVEGSFSNL